MAPENPIDELPPEAELAENEDKKESEVLNREGVEQDLMQQDESGLGEDLEDVEDE